MGRLVVAAVAVLLALGRAVARPAGAQERSEIGRVAVRDNMLGDALRHLLGLPREGG